MAGVKGSGKGKRGASPKGRSIAARKEDAPAPLKTPSKMPEASKLVALAKLKRSTKKQVQSLNGTYAEKVGDLIDKQNLNKIAWGIAVKLEGLEPEVLNVVMPHLDAYIEALKIRETAASAPGLGLEEDDQGDEAAEDEPARRTSNVRDFLSPRAEAAE